MLPEPPPEQEREAASPRGGRASADRPLPNMNATNKAGLTLLQVANERAKHKSQRFLMVSSPDL